MNKVHELIRRACFDAETFVQKSNLFEPKLISTRDTLMIRVNRTVDAGIQALGVELFASRPCWELFVTKLQDEGFVVETRRWSDFSPNIYQYDLYIEAL